MGSFPETFYDLEIENPDNWCPGEFALEFYSDPMKISCIFQLQENFPKIPFLAFEKFVQLNSFFTDNSIQFFKKLE